MKLKIRTFYTLSACGLVAAAMLFNGRVNAQNLTLEGYTGGFITPTAYVVPSEKGQLFSHPAIGYHFIASNAVIGDIHTFGIAEGIGNRAEVAYGRNVHITGDSTSFSQLWHFNGMNIFSGKIVAIKDGEFHKFMPGVAVGGITRTQDRFVSSPAAQLAVEFYDATCECTPVPIPAAKSYSNGDVYIVATKTWAKPPVPFLATFGWKMTNASILGLGGQSTRFMGRFFGGLGLPLPGPWKTAIIPSAGAMQEPPQIQNLSALLFSMSPEGPVPGAPAHIPTTLDYAIRVTQREHPHFTFDIGVGQVAGMIGTTLTPTGLPSPYPPFAPLAVNLQARHVVATGLSYRY
ncbi:MAG: hypothetical protein ABSA48_05790 [Terracidiphilus sp.]|jgi:hypothetical protein